MREAADPVGWPIARVRGHIVIESQGVADASPNEHPGIDVDLPYDTPIYAPADGEVICVGGDGKSLWGQPCGGFRDTGDLGPSADDLGVGNITVLLESGHKITFGHCRQAFRNPGDRVQAGQMLGTSGGMFGAHLHIEVARCEPALTGDAANCYWLYDPVTELSNAMSPRIAFAPRVPLPQPHELGVSVPVTATRDGVPVLQRASTDASNADVPLQQGEAFAGVMVVLGDDRNWYWVSSRGAYIPVAGTTTPQGPHVSIS